MNIPGTKIWYSKKNAQELNLIESRDITVRDLKRAVRTLAERMVKDAKQSKSQVDKVYEFLWEVAL